MQRIQLYPSAIGGLCLGLASIAIYWSHTSVILQCAISILTCILLIPLLIKFIKHPRQLWEDLRHPTLGSTLPTSSMTIMLLSFNMPHSSKLAIGLWLLAVIMHFCFFTSFIYHRIKNFNFDHLIPSWFVPPIGIVVACLTVPSPIFATFAKIILIFGLSAYMVLLPAVIYRLCLHPSLDHTRKPTLAVLAAPASLILAGYLTLSIHPNSVLIIFLFSIAVLMTFSVYVMLFHLLRIAFSPTFSAFTFPLVISATATLKVSQWASHEVLFSSYTPILQDISIVQAILASIVITYVLVHYGRYLVNLWRTEVKIWS